MDRDDREKLRLFHDRLVREASRRPGFLASWMPLDEGFRARFRERYGLDGDRWTRLMLTAPRSLRHWAYLARDLGIPTRRLMGAMWAARAVRAAREG